MRGRRKRVASGLAIYGALQYYKILSYKTFYKKVLGEKIAEKKSEKSIRSKAQKLAENTTM